LKATSSESLSRFSIPWRIARRSTTTSMEWREHVDARALGPRHDAVDDLLHALLRDLAPAVVAKGVADAREQQAQVIVNLGDGSDGRARVARGRLLLDRDRRRQPLDRIDVRLLHLLEELARVGRKRFDVTALALCINRVEGERGLARARKPGDNDQAIAWNLKVDILEIVLARALDDYSIRHRRQTSRLTPVRLAGTA
jgi:hypothetical protein